jgi:hypothetical protein
MCGTLEFRRLLGEEDDLAAIHTICKVSERGDALMLRQSVLGEGAELPRVGMAVEMERFAHGTRPGGAVLSENG